MAGSQLQPIDEAGAPAKKSSAAADAKRKVPRLLALVGKDEGVSSTQISAQANDKPALNIRINVAQDPNQSTGDTT